MLTLWDVNISLVSSILIKGTTLKKRNTQSISSRNYWRKLQLVTFVIDLCLILIAYEKVQAYNVVNILKLYQTLKFSIAVPDLVLYIDSTNI